MPRDRESYLNLPDRSLGKYIKREIEKAKQNKIEEIYNKAKSRHPDDCTDDDQGKKK